MALCNVIKEKRKELGYTQEQVADYLGITAPAVNKWERGITYPDFSLLSPLARLLKTDINTLLCFQEELSEQEIETFCKQIMNTILKEGFESGYKLVREKLQEYPNQGRLLKSITPMLSGAMFLCNISKEEKEKYEVEINVLYEQMLNCEESDIRNSAAFMLASKYIASNQFKEAQEMIDLLPEYNAMDKRMLQAQLHRQKGELYEAELIHEKILVMGITNVWNHILTLEEIELKLGHVSDAEKLADICYRSARDLQLTPYYQATPLFMIHSYKKDKAECLKQLEKMLEYSNSKISMWDVKGTILFRNLKKQMDDLKANQSQEEQKKTNTINIIPAIFQEIKSNEDYDFLRDDEKYLELVEKYSS